MSTFFATLRQDLVATRWVLLGWFSLPFVLVHITPLPTDHSIAKTYATLFLTLAWVVHGLVLFARIAFNHAPCDDRNGWRARPLRGWVVGLEKLFFATLALLPPLLAAPHKLQITPQLLTPFLVLLFALFVASLVKTPKQLIATLSILACLFLLLGFVKGLLGIRSTFSDTGAIVAKSVFALGFVGLFIRQFARPHVQMHATAGIGVYLLIVTVSWIFPNPTRPISLIVESAPVVQLVDVTQMADEDMFGIENFTAMDRFWVERVGKVRRHLNGLARFKVSEVNDRDVWFVKSFDALSRQRVGQRQDNPPCYFPTENLARRVGLGGYHFIDQSEVTFERQFQWLIREDADVPRFSPAATDFRLTLHRVKPVLWVQASLQVGEHGRPETNSKRPLEISAIDSESRVFEGRLNLPEFTDSRLTFSRNNRNMPYAIVAWNPDTKEAGFVRQRSRPWLPRDAQPDETPDRFELPHLSGDPSRWRITIFHGITDGRAEIKPADILPPSPSVP